MSGRRRATIHCKDCRYHSHQGTPRAAHYCWNGVYMKISGSQARTSPDWCPRGHIIPEVPYPTFSPGKDPVAGVGPGSCTDARAWSGTPGSIIGRVSR